MRNKKEKSTSLSDRPCKGQDEDFFNTKDRIVSKIINFLSDSEMLPLSIAITGE